MCAHAADPRNGGVRVEFCPEIELRGMDPKHVAFAYAPSYLRALEGTAGRERWLEDMTADFWQHASEHHQYLPDRRLLAGFTPLLSNFLEAGVFSRGGSPHAALFHPPGGGGGGGGASPLRLYIHGPAGCGKSQFVVTAAAALQATLRAHVKPDARVVVCKVPLNAATGQSLRAAANVRGVSDMSVERVCEQAVSKGRVDIVLSIIPVLSC